jgi:nucleoid-associated protein YgaU
MSVLGQASQEFDNIITVGSAQDFDPSIAPAEGFNRTDYSSYGYGLDIMANGGTTVGAGVGTMAGTSVATAEVTGAVSQVWAANPQLSYRQVIEIIKSTATDLDTPNWDAITGAGLLNLVAAVLLAKVTTPLEYDAPATVIPATWSGEGKVTPTERATATEFRDKYYEWESYKVQRGDTLSAIALRTMGNGTKPYYDFIARRNGIANPDQLPEGITIYIPREVSYCG